MDESDINIPNPINIVSEEQFFLGEVHKVMRILSDHVCQIFSTENKNGKPRTISFASGVFFECKGNGFIFTAAHVFTNSDFPNLFILRNDYKFPLKGEIFLTQLQETGDEHSDPYDLGIIRLEEGLYHGLKPYVDFIDFSKIEFDHNNSPEKRYVISGFPSRRTRLSKGRFKCEISTIMTTVKDSAKLNLVFNQESHLLLHHNPKGIYELGKKHSNKPPLLNGISGGGVWLIEHDPEFNKHLLVNGNLPYKLVGIIIEQVVENRETLIIATKLDAIINHLIEVYGFILPRPRLGTKIKLKFMA